MIPVPDVSDLSVAFPIEARDIAPPWDEIPDEFKQFRGTPESRLFQDVFYRGELTGTISPREGVDMPKALRALSVVARDWGIRHEHKEAAWAMLFREWFHYEEDVDGPK